jgi:hypothetical protein
MQTNVALSRLLLVVTCLAFAVTAATVRAEQKTYTFPTLTTNDLNGRSATFPTAFPGERTVVLIAFKRDQQKALDVWIDALGLKGENAPAWIEMPVIANYGSIWRAFVDRGMRSGIVTTEARSKVFTVYDSPAGFRSTLGLPTEDQVYILVVKRDGTIIARVDGAYSKTKALAIQSVLTD